tara:strand:- start:351 stop:638 length:288 start_codon:yes stop_codon:yes gene_type:complete
MQYKFKEDQTLKQIKKYIDETYRSHYAQDKYQATDIIIDQGLGEGFALGNIIKYVIRFGKKDGKSKNDLMKIVHYAIIALFVLEQEEKVGQRLER